MQAKTAKQEIIETLERLPDDVGYEDALSELHLQAKIRRGIEQAERGETIPHSQVMEELDEWLKSIGQ